jgi:hypothetical protein
MSSSLETVKLISADGFEFIMDKKSAMGSGMMKNMLATEGDGQFFAEAVENKIHFRNVKCVV